MKLLNLFVIFILLTTFAGCKKEQQHKVGDCFFYKGSTAPMNEYSKIIGIADDQYAIKSCTEDQKQNCFVGPVRTKPFSEIDDSKLEIPITCDDI